MSAIRFFDAFRRRVAAATETFAAHQGGNVALIFALVFVFAFVAVGGVIDTTQLLRVRSSMQQGADAAALSAVRYLGTDESERKSLADKIYLANVTDLKGAAAGQLANSGTLYSYTATYDAPTSFLTLIGMNQLTMTVGSTATTSTDSIDVALVLDSSGSMAGTRMTELKKAVKLFLGSFTAGNDAKVSMVPFDSQVRIDPSLATVASKTGTPTNPYGSSVDCNTLTDPQDRANCQAMAPPPTIDCGTFNNVSYRNVAQSRCYSSYNSGFKTGTSGQFNECIQYDLFGIICLKWENYNYSTVDTGSAIVASRSEWGCTQWFLLICTQYGWTNQVTLETKSYTKSTSQTVSTTKTVDDLSNTDNLLFDPPSSSSGWTGCLIDRTQPYDTTNDAPSAGVAGTLYPKANCNQNSLYYIQGLTSSLSSLSSLVDNLQPSGNTNITIGIQWGMETLSSTDPFTGVRTGSHRYMIVMTDGRNTQNRWSGNSNAAIDARTTLACTNAKNAGIVVYTINLIEGNGTLLTACASDASKYYLVTNASQLSDVFSQIAKAIRHVRITN